MSAPSISVYKNQWYPWLENSLCEVEVHKSTKSIAFVT